MKTFVDMLWVLLHMYIGAGMFAAAMISAAIPALNWLGMSYIAITWPAQVLCAPVDSGCDPMPPEWAAQYFFNAEN